MREQQRQARGLPPLRESRDQELVDDDLRAVGEVPVLRLPDHERLRRGDRISVLEAHGRVLGERRVVQLEAGSRAIKVLDGREWVARLRVEQGLVPLAEGAANRVLPRDADRHAVEEERAERQ